MTTITKEWLQQTIAEFENTRDDIPFGLDEDDAMILASLKMLLTGIEQEPVAFIGERMLDELTDGARSCGRVWPAGKDRLSGKIRIPLYAAPQLSGNSEQVGWIKCSERMPLCLPEGVNSSNTIEVIVTDGKSVGTCDCMSGSLPKPWVAFSSYGSMKGTDITHWMPLPAAPQQEQSND